MQLSLKMYLLPTYCITSVANTVWHLELRFFFFALLSRKFAMVLVGLPHAVLLSYICYKLAEKAGLIFYLKTKYHVLKQLIATVRHASHQVDIEEGFDNDPFPDRLQNPENYGPDAQEHTNSEPMQSTESTREPIRLTPVYTYM